MNRFVWIVFTALIIAPNGFAQLEPIQLDFSGATEEEK